VAERTLLRTSCVISGIVYDQIIVGKNGHSSPKGMRLI
jgi:hypothetical protein